MQLCGVPVLSVMVLELLVPMRKDCGLFIRKSRNQFTQFGWHSLRDDDVKRSAIIDEKHPDIKVLFYSRLVSDSCWQCWSLTGWDSKQVGEVQVSLEEQLWCWWLMNSLSKHLIMTNVRAAGQHPFRQDTGDFFGTWTIVLVLKQIHWNNSMKTREVLKISMRMSANWSAHAFSTQPGMLSGPAALCHDNTI